MSQPQVTAIVSAEDRASAVISKIVGDVRQAGHEMAVLAQREMDHATASAKAARTALDAQRQQLAGFKAEALAAFGGIAAHGVHAMMEIGGEMERTQRRFAAFTNASKEQLAAIRRDADTTGAGLKGGAEGYFEGARAAAMSGVKPEHAGLVSRYGAVFADETGEDNAAATEKLVQHTMMMQHLRDEAGKPLSFGEANTEQVDRALRETLNLLISINKVAPGNINNVYEGFKFAGPTMLGLGRDPIETASLYTELASHGIVGSEAGNTIKSSVARLLSPTAKARQAIATGGLNYGDYIHADADVASVEGIEKGLSLRLGKLDTSTEAAVRKAIENFKAGDHNLDSFNRELTDAIMHSGVKSVQDRLKASNVSRDTIANFASTADLPKFLKDAHDKGLGVGFLDAVFGQQQGGRLAAVSGEQVLKYEDQYRTETQKDNVGAAMRERAESYDGLRDRFYGALKGAEDQLFQAGLREPAREGYKLGGDLLEGVAHLPERVKAWAAEMGVATSVIGGSAAVSVLSRVAGALTGLGEPAEGAIGGLLRLAGTIGRFSSLGYAGAALGGLQLGNALGEAATGLGEVIGGKYYTPTTPEDMEALRSDRDAARAEIERRRAAAFDPNAHDPELKRLEGELAAAKARAAQPGEDNAELKRLEGELAALKTRKPPEDPEIPRLEARLSDLDRKMGTAPDPKEGLLRAVIQRRQDLDPRDPGLPRLREQLERMHGDQQRQAVDLGGAPAELRAEIERRHAADLEAARAEVERKERELSDFRAHLTMSPNELRKDVEDAQGRLDARRAENDRLRADKLGTDPSITALQDEVAHLEGRLAAGMALQKVMHPNPFLTAEEPVMHQGPAYPVSAAQPAGNPFLAQATAGFTTSSPTAPGLPAPAPMFPLDAWLARLPKASGGLNDLDIGAQIRGALTGLPPAKIDVPPLAGTVTGSAEVATTIGVNVSASPLLTATVDHVKALTATIGLAVKMGDQMRGTNGVQLAPVHGMNI